MKKQAPKWLTFVVALVVIIAFAIGGQDLVDELLNLISTEQAVILDDNGNSIVKGMLKIHYIDVGQGDSILLQNENAAILIDGGTRETGDELVEYISSQGVSTLNYVVATHPHEDHIGGLDEAINAFEVQNILMPKKSANTKVFSDMAAAIKNKGLKAKQPEVGDTIRVADMQITTLAPNRDNYSETNDWSIVLKVDYKNNSFLFTGDAEKISEQDIIHTGINLKSDVLKTGHHGSSSSSSQEFMDKIKPKYAVISLGENNSYKHPHNETLQTFKNNKIITYRTDRNGTIIAISDGQKINFQVQKGEQGGYTDTDKRTYIK